MPPTPIDVAALRRLLADAMGSGRGLARLSFLAALEDAAPALLRAVEERDAAQKAVQAACEELGCLMVPDSGSCEQVIIEDGVRRLLAAARRGNENAVAAVMLDRWRERRKRFLDGVAPTLAEIQAAMPSWTNIVVAYEKAPDGSGMRRTIDAADAVIGMLWKHSEALRERFDFEMAQRDELHASYTRAVEERDALLAACDAKDNLLACYRLGKRPSEALLKRLDDAGVAIRRAKEPQ